MRFRGVAGIRRQAWHAPRMAPSSDDVRGLLGEQLGALSELVGGLSDHELVRASGCEGWRIADLLVHLRLGAEGLLCGLATPTDAPADRDFVSYWRDWPREGPATFDDVRWTWASAASYATADSLRGHFAVVVDAARLAAHLAPPGRIAFQGHVCDIDDFLTMWIVELALRQLDLLVGVPDRPDPHPQAFELTTLTLDGLLGPDRPPAWDRLTYAKKGSGREPLDVEDRTWLANRASAYPAFG